MIFIFYKNLLRKLKLLFIRINVFGKRKLLDLIFPFLKKWNFIYLSLLFILTKHCGKTKHIFKLDIFFLFILLIVKITELI